ncbi:epimerase [Streptomyces sp. NPDC057027]|uniref:epimerase n=1 Tax=Streptomyces sp. NPDC057027 TaxID=3346004 RepID=UPI003624BB05
MFLEHMCCTPDLRDDAVTEVLAVVRTPPDVARPKLRQIVHADFTDYTAIQHQFTSLDACFYCLGVSAVGRSEAECTRVTHDYAPAAVRALIAASPNLTLVYVSGEGTDPAGKSRQVWARVKGRTENDLRALPLTAAGRRGRFPDPVLPRALPCHRGHPPAAGAPLPRYVTTTDAVGRAMLAAVRPDSNAPVLFRWACPWILC